MTSGLSPRITKLDEAGRYVICYTGEIPYLSRDVFRLTICFENHTFLLSLDEIEALQQVSFETELDCHRLSHPNGAVWEGISFKSLIHYLSRLVGHEMAFSAVRFTSFGTPYTVELPGDAACNGQALLALRMNDQPLLPEHGGPLRLVVAGLGSETYVKWLAQIQFT